LGYEIESRVRQIRNSATIGTSVNLGRTALVFSGTRSRVSFDDAATFRGEDLSQALNQVTDTAEIQFRYRLTPLTTFVVNADALQDRFGAGGLRNADSIRVMPGFEMKPSALVAGKVFVGVRDLHPLDSRVP